VPVIGATRKGDWQKMLKRYSNNPNLQVNTSELSMGQCRTVKGVFVGVIALKIHETKC